MSESNDNRNPEGTENGQFARLFAEFMRTSIAQSQQITTTTPNHPETQRIDTSPLLIGTKLNGENYSLWAIHMMAAISGRGMISHITGVPTPPARTDPTFSRWQQGDHCVFTWLIQNLEQKLVNRVSQYPTARDVWKSLEVTYASGGDKIQVYDLYTRANRLKQTDESLEDIWTILNDLWVSIDQKQPNRMQYPEDIKIYNNEKEEQRLYQLLVALNDKYEGVKKEILRLEPLPSVEVAYGILRREDTRASILKAGDNGAAQGVAAGLIARQPWINQSAHRPSPHRSGGNADGNWNKKTEEEKLRLTCTHCGKKKHTRDTCFELHGYPEWWEEWKSKPPPRGGRGMEAVANGGGEPVAAAIGGNAEATTSRGNNQPEEITLRTVSFAHGGIGEDTAQMGGGNGRGTLGFGDLSQSPITFGKLIKAPHPIKYPHLQPKQIINSEKHPTSLNIPESAPLVCKNKFQPLENLSDNLPTSYALSISSSTKNDKWIFDCGATDTVTFDKSDISSMHMAPKSYIQNANGELTPVVGAGTVKISPSLTLSNCLYVPSMSHKLLSISHVTKELNCTLLMQPNFCLLQDIRTGKIIGRGTE
ncbi:uncharacterized protein LOC121774557 [Salvia splendens]|uniref:uncharacterized protein LOC121774557 n=1 Tax=Salvia splendens TaxID=180675 RepID=UPI001C25AD17|nr:uncharacterized protein LOC121774557 [Salvia splendens]